MKRIILIVTILILSTTIAQAQIESVPSLINYQGMLTDADGNPLTGTKKLEFNLYDAATGGNKIWGPQIFNNVPLVNGQFNVILGTTDTAGRSIADAFSSDNCYLSIRVDDGQELSPRQQILSAPYAIHAAVAGTVRGSDLYVDPNNGNVGIGTTEPEDKLTVNGTVHSTGGIKYSDGTLQTTAGLPSADYDSGWFHAQNNRSYNKEHNLGTLPRLAIVWGADDENGTNMFLIDTLHGYGSMIKNITTNSCTIWTGVNSARDGGSSTDCFIKILMWK